MPDVLTKIAVSGLKASIKRRNDEVSLVEVTAEFCLEEVASFIFA